MPTWSSAPSWTAGQSAGVSSGLQTMSDDLNVIGNAWTPYTPTLNNITLGNGTLAGRYRATGKFVTFSVTLTFGSTTSVSGSNSTMTLPVTPQAGNWVSTDCAGYDTSANQWFPLAIVTAAAGGGPSTSTFLIKLFPTSAGSNLVTITSTTPFTWATGDIITVTATYEAA